MSTAPVRHHMLIDPEANHAARVVRLSEALLAFAREVPFQAPVRLEVGVQNIEYFYAMPAAGSRRDDADADAARTSWLDVSHPDGAPEPYPERALMLRVTYDVDARNVEFRAEALALARLCVATPSVAGARYSTYMERQAPAMRDTVCQARLVYGVYKRQPLFDRTLEVFRRERATFSADQLMRYHAAGEPSVVYESDLDDDDYAAQDQVHYDNGVALFGHVNRDFCLVRPWRDGDDANPDLLRKATLLSPDRNAMHAMVRVGLQCLHDDLAANHAHLMAFVALATRDAMRHTRRAPRVVHHVVPADTDRSFCSMQ